MQILQLVAFRTSKDETEGMVFDRALRLLTDTGYDPEKIRFRFEDRPEQIRKSSSVDRAIRAYPQLAPFRAEVVEQWNNNQQLSVLSNYHKARELRSVPVPQGCVPAAILSEIMHGIPRRFPFWLAEILFNDVGALNMPTAPVDPANTALTDRGLTGPGLIAESRWWTSRRLRTLEGITAASPSEDGTGLIAAPGAESLFSNLGKVIGTEIKITPDPLKRAEFERQITEATFLTDRYKENPFAGAPGTSLPHFLPSPTHGMGVPLIERREAGIPSVKELLNVEFKPMGYRYKSSLSGQGTYTLQKKGLQNYVLEVFVDVSPIGGQFCGRFGVTAPQGFFAVPLQLPPFGHDYPVDEHLPTVVKNTAFVVQKLEHSYVAALESILGPAAPWFPGASICR